MIRCRTCKKQLGEAQARFCPDGHRQPTPSSVKVKNEDRHTDDEDDLSDDEVQVISSRTFKKVTDVRKILPIKETQALRDKAGIRDSNRKQKEMQRGQYGIRPQNVPPKTTISIWLAETPPVKAIYAGVSARIHLDPTTRLQSQEDVNRFIRDIIEDVPTLHQHAAFISGELRLDTTRLAWVGSPEEKSMAWNDISQDVSTVEELLATLGPKDLLYFCVPVQRTSLIKVAVGKGRDRGESMTDQAPVAKRARSKGDKIKTEPIKKEGIKQEDTKKRKIKKENVKGKKVKKYVLKEEDKEEKGDSDILKEEDLGLSELGDSEGDEGVEDEADEVEAEEVEAEEVEAEEVEAEEVEAEVVVAIERRRSTSGRYVRKPLRFEA